VRKHLLVAVALAASVIGHPASAQRASFNPSDTCDDVLQIESSLDAVLAGLWAFGYLAKASDQRVIVDDQRNEQMLKNLKALCVDAPETSFFALVDKMAKDQSNASNSTASSGTSMDAREFLEQFFAAGADFSALTMALKPSEQDIRAVYDEPLASALIGAYENVFQPGNVIRPKSGQDTLLLLETTTSELKAGAEILAEFPGGYDEVRALFLEDVPIVRFKFVERGESSGLSFDGLIFVNGHWVLMPKPWRAMP